MYKLQTTFNRVARHLLKQRRRAETSDYRGTGCVYLAPNGDRCAAGCLIPPKEYSVIFEGLRVGDICEKLGEQTFFNHDISLVKRLQLIHDECEVKNWKKELKGVAIHFRLDDSVLEEF